MDYLIFLKPYLTLNKWYARKKYRLYIQGVTAKKPFRG